MLYLKKTTTLIFKKRKDTVMKTAPFRRFGTMIDCSRNAVMNVESLKKWIGICSDLGFNTVLLYTEDTYEIPEEPYFGYLRGRYSQDEIREVDAFAKEKGIELIPCIQTLAHLNAITRWPAFQPMIDIGDILLAGEEKVYELIDRMFASIAASYSTKIVNIGMDEAHMIGRGSYYDRHGDTDKTKILLEHLHRVAEIGKKYGFTLIMWSDMFFRLAVGGYYNGKAEINEEVKKQIPDNVELIYWDYYSTDRKHYDEMFTAHKKIKDGTWFAGGLWTWIGYAAHNAYSMRATKAALDQCIKNGIKDVFLTMWGDDGGECSKYSLLPSLFYASEIAKGVTKKEDIKADFKKKFGISFDRFMLLDLPGIDDVEKNGVLNTERYLLYNDPFCGILDSTLLGDEGERFAKCARKLSYAKNEPEWGYLFRTLHALCETLAVKANLGQRIRAAYGSKDKDAIIAAADDCKKTQKKLDGFYNAYRDQWYAENKGQGFDVQDIRIGGLKQRLAHCEKMLRDFADGKIEKIDELEEPLLDLHGNGADFRRGPICYQSWRLTSTASVL